MSSQFFNEIEFTDTAQLVTYGSGSPEGSVSAPVGSVYLRSDGASGSAAYLKTSGSGNTGWEAFVDAGSTVDGSGGANEVAYWLDADTLTSNGNFTFNGSDLTVPVDLILDGNSISPTTLQGTGSGGAKTITFPNTSSEVVVLAGSQTITGTKTFTQLAAAFQGPGSASTFIRGLATSSQIVDVPDGTGIMVLADSFPSGEGYFLRSNDASGVGGWDPIDANDLPPIPLDLLDDVIAANPNDGDVLVYTGGSLNYWETVAASSLFTPGIGNQNEIAFWSDDFSLLGDPNLTYDGAVITIGGGDDVLATSTGTIVTIGRSSLDVGVHFGTTAGSSTNNIWRAYSYKSFSSTIRSRFQFYASRGSGPGSESALTINDYVGSLEWFGVNSGSSFVNTAEIRVTATENWGGSAAGSRMGFFTLNDSVPGSPAERFRISTEGIRSLTDFYVNGDTFLLGANNATTSFVVYYNDSTGELTYGDAPSGGGGAVELNELIDVSVGDAEEDDVLAFVGGSAGGWFPFSGYITLTPDEPNRNLITPTGTAFGLVIDMPASAVHDSFKVEQDGQSRFNIQDDGTVIAYGGFAINQANGATRFSWAGNIIGATYAYIESAQPGFGRSAGHIILSPSTSADAGTIDVSAGSATGSDGGSINLSGAATLGAAGGTLNLSGAVSGGSGSSITGVGSSGFSGGTIITSAGSAGGGGVILTAGGSSAAGGSILTNDGGGNIITNSPSNSFIGLGTATNRVTVQTSSPGSAYFQDLANSDGAILVDPDSVTVPGSIAFSTSTSGVIEFRDLTLDEIADVNVGGSFAPDDGDYLQYFAGSADEWRSTPTIELERIVANVVNIPTTNSLFLPLLGIDIDGRIERAQNTTNDDTIAYITASGSLGIQANQNLAPLTMTGYGGVFDELGGGAITWQRTNGSSTAPTAVSNGPFFIFTDGRGVGQGSSMGFFQAQAYNGTSFQNAAWIGAYVDTEGPNVGTGNNEVPGRWVFMTSSGDGTEAFPQPALIVKSTKNVEISRGDLQLFNQKGIELWDATNTGMIYIRPPESVTGEGSLPEVTFTLPNTGGQPDQALLTDGTGVLRWGDVVASGGGGDDGDANYISVTIDDDTDGSALEYNPFESDSFGSSSFDYTINAENNIEYDGVNGTFTVNQTAIYVIEISLVVESTSNFDPVDIRVKNNGVTIHEQSPTVHSSVDPENRGVLLITPLTAGDEITVTIADQNATANIALKRGSTCSIFSLGGSGGAQSLNDLLDVNVPNPSDGEYLCYVGGSINEWQAASVGSTSYIGIWAEETSALSTSTGSGYQWSFGNGDLAVAGSGIHVPVDCDLIFMGLSSENSGTATVSVTINGSEPGAAVSTSSQTDNSATFSEGTYSLSAGDIVNFRTTAYTSGHTVGTRVVAWFKVTEGAGAGGGGGSGSGTPGGANTQVQYNDSGTFGGDPDFTWNDTTNTLTISGTLDATTIRAPDAEASDTHVLYNSSGNVASESAFTYTASTNTLQIDAGFVVLSGNSGLSVGETTTTAGGLRFKRNSASPGFIRAVNDNGTEFGFQLRSLGTEEGISITNQSAATEYMRINTDGDVGIGTDSPIARLHVYDTGSTTSRMVFETNSTANFPGVQAQWDASGLRRALMRGAAVTSLNTTGVGNATEWQFYTRTTGGTLNQNMILDMDGHLNLNFANELRLWNATGWTGGNYIGLSASGATGTQTYILPTSVGSSGQYLELDNSGTGQLVWSTPSGSGVSFGSSDQIPHMNAGGTDFDYSANLTFNGTALLPNIVRGSNGSASAPTYSFSADSNSGMYAIALDNIAISAGGVTMMEFTESTTDFIESFVQHRFDNGSLSAPGISFVSDPDCGMYRITTDNIAIVAGGVNMMEFTESTTDLIQSFVTHEFSDGTLSVLAMRFTSDTNSGFYHRSSDEWALVAGGVEMIILDESSQDNVVIPGNLVFGSTTQYTGFTQAITGTPDDTIWALPSSDGTDGQVMKTDGFGELRWENPIGAGTTFPSSPDDGLYYHRTDDDWLYHNDDGRGRWLGELETYTFTLTGTATADAYLFCNNHQHSSGGNDGIYTPYDFTVVGISFTNANSVSGVIEVESFFNGTIASLTLSSDTNEQDMTINGFASADIWKVFIDYTSGTFEDVTVCVYIRRDRGSSGGGIA